MAELLTGTSRRRAINKQIREAAGQGPISRVTESTPAKLTTCCLQGRRAPEFAGGVFQQFLEEAATAESSEVAPVFIFSEKI